MMYVKIWKVSIHTNISCTARFFADKKTAETFSKGMQENGYYTSVKYCGRFRKTDSVHIMGIDDYPYKAYTQKNEIVFY